LKCEHSAGGTGDVENVWKEKSGRDPCYRNRWRRVFRRRRNSHRRRRCHGWTNSPGADPGQASPDPRPVGGPQGRSGAVSAQDRFVQTIRNRATRSLSSAEREEIATIAKDKPNIDLEINFDYNSADISRRSLSSVQALGQALTNPDLKGSTFIVAGHTDAVGGDAYNQDLSERRADSIKRYLTDKFGIAGSDLVTVGYGKTKLKDPGHPTADVNRRVQVVNMANKTTASQ
jgi:outer membrane protein OmpA-like peptidoglycan-associated protein